MSKVSISGDQNGTANFTIKAPNSNTDRTLTLPDEEGTVATIENIPPGYEDQDALDLFNATGSAPVYACRAWVTFDGTGGITIKENGNVSSVTDINTGKYTFNFTTSMPDINYAIVGTSGGNGGTSGDESNFTTQTPSSTSGTPQLRFRRVADNTYYDIEHASIAVFR